MPNARGVVLSLAIRRNERAHAKEQDTHENGLNTPPNFTAMPLFSKVYRASQSYRRLLARSALESISITFTSLCRLSRSMILRRQLKYIVRAYDACLRLVLHSRGIWAHRSPGAECARFSLSASKMTTAPLGGHSIRAHWPWPTRRALARGRCCRYAYSP